MVLDFTRILNDSLLTIGSTKETAEFVIFDMDQPCSPEEIQIRYSKALWTVVEVINGRYASKLPFEFNLYNWIEHNHKDELAYFLNEASSNCMNYSDYKSSYKFVIHFGEKGFIVGVLQQGKGFNAELIFPLTEQYKVAGVFFYDRGDVYKKSENIDLGNQYSSIGTGIRWNSPVGPLRLEYGWVIEGKDVKETWDGQFEFSIGASF